VRIYRNVKLIPTLGELWAKYLPWAREHKKTWDDDMFNYQKHLEPRFGKKRLDAIASIDIERMKLEPICADIGGQAVGRVILSILQLLF
jgi:hypothetical protein